MILFSFNLLFIIYKIDETNLVIGNKILNKKIKIQTAIKSNLRCSIIKVTTS